MAVAALAAAALAVPIEVIEAQPASSEAGPAERPWAEGVLVAQQQQALELYQAGNELLDNLRFTKAVDTYRQAISHWDHPSIQYNLTIALINLDQPIEAYRAVLGALRYGAAPLEPEEYKQALNYRRLLENQVAEIELMCDQPGVQVKLDGEVVLTGPNRFKQLVLPGQRQIVAEKTGHKTITRPILVLPGETKRVTLGLFSEDELTVRRRYWAAWRPWAVAGAGLAVVSVGGVFHWRAKVNLDVHDDERFSELCPNGCFDDDALAAVRLRTRAMWYQRFGVSLYVVGGAALVTGIALVYANRPRKERLDRSDDEVRVSVVPAVSPETAGVAVTGSF